LGDHDDSRGAGGRARSSRLRPLLRWGLLALALALVVHLLAGVEWAELADRLAAAHPAWVAVAVVLLLARFVAWTWRWRLAVVRLGTPPGLLPLYSMVMASVVINHITPTARVIGGVMRARYLARRTGGTAGRAFGGVLFDQLVHQATMVAVTVLGVIAAGFAVGRHRLAWWSLLGLSLAGAAAAAAWLRWRTSANGGLDRLARYLAERAGADGPARRAFAHGRHAIDALSALLEDGRLIAAAVAIGGLYALVNAGAQWAVFRALGQEPGFLIVLAAVSLGMAAGAIAGTPGGVGATEAGMIGAFVLFGVDRVDATAASLLYRGLHYATVLAVGTPALVWLELKRRATQPAAADDARLGGASAEPKAPDSGEGPPQDRRSPVPGHRSPADR
jgi:uncharacterized membrane protein YbhN (UPF0104 family)